MRRVACPSIDTEAGAKCEAWMATLPAPAESVNLPSASVVARRSPEPLVICAPAIGFPVASTTIPMTLPEVACCCGAAAWPKLAGAHRTKTRKRALRTIECIVWKLRQNRLFIGRQFLIEFADCC